MNNTDIPKTFDQIRNNTYSVMNKTVSHCLAKVYVQDLGVIP